MRIELLWFSGCPNHEAAERLLRERLDAFEIDVPIQRIQVETDSLAKEVCFPGSPTIRIEGLDVEPGWTPCEDCTPRCRLYATSQGLRGLPEVSWIDAALRRVVSQ